MTTPPPPTSEVLAASRFRLAPQPFLYVSARAVRTPELHLLVCRDELETTVVTTAEHMTDLDVVDVNPDRWALFAIDCANPFYCVGFLATISAAMAARGIDVLVASTFTRDLILVKESVTGAAREALLECRLLEIV